MVKIEEPTPTTEVVTVVPEEPTLPQVETTSQEEPVHIGGPPVEEQKPKPRRVPKRDEH